MAKALSKIPAWHAEAKQILGDKFAEVHQAFVSATNRAVWLGLFLNYIKERGREDGSIPHGEFGPWLQRELPDIPWRSARLYMEIARGVAEKGHFHVADFCEFARESKMDFLQILTADRLPPKLAEIKETVERIVEGKTQVQLMLEFKNLGADGEPRGPGRLPGEGGSRKLTLSEQAQLLRVKAEQHSRVIERELYVYRSQFMMLTDEQIMGEEAVLDLALKARRAWLKMPKNNRDAHAIEALFTRG